MTIIRPTSAELALESARLLVQSCRESIARRAAWRIALTGGSSPVLLYQLLASREWQAQIDWARTHVFWGDDRAVPPTDALSNFRQADELLLCHVKAGRVCRMKGEADDLDAAARDYATELGDAPLDAVLLGVGPDGHVASLFPGSPQLTETERACVATPVAPINPPVRRLTLTMPTINRAQLVLITVADAKKRDIVRRALDGDPSLPVARVQPAGELVWLLDEATAA